MITVFGLALAWVHLPNERITRLKVVAVLLGIGGVAVIFIEQLQINSLMAFAGCAAIVFGAYAAAHGSILVKAYGGAIHPATLVFGQMICGIAPVIIYRSRRRRQSASFKLELAGDNLRSLPERFRNRRGVLALLLAFK
jgi:drug/metabolite transporter (DMT)-like permease